MAQSKGNIPDYKKFSGKRYHYKQLTQSKRNATAIAKRLRGQGYLIRVHPIIFNKKKEYVIYTYPKHKMFRW